MKTIHWVQIVPGVSMINGHLFIEYWNKEFVWHILPVSYFSNGDVI